MTIGALASHLGIHRNTIHHYLSGHSVFPAHLNKIFTALDLEPYEILRKKDPPTIKRLEPIADIIDQLERKFPHITFVLFGSRTRPRHHPYADWDIGVFSVEGIPHALYRQIKRELGERTENFPYPMDLTNLNRADREFLQNAARGWVFLGGRLKDWVILNQRTLHEETERVH
ncbi:MAG: nucleotidyltransferase domain-containing protein [Deltaproteobacteria bacterium]|nr:nucleotidyltransferase domain-containing protein [Deltaproteobacteria bacterium]